MPFDAGSAYNEAVDWVLNGEFVRRVSRNPIWTAIIITTIMVFLAWVVLPKLGGFKRVAKLWVLSTISVTLIMCLHNHVLMEDHDTAAKTVDYSRVFNRSENLKAMSGIPDIPVTPQLVKGGREDTPKTTSGFDITAEAED
jgi:hypothetical protein